MTSQAAARLTDQAFYAMREAGATYRAIGEHFGVCTQRAVDRCHRERVRREWAAGPWRAINYYHAAGWIWWTPVEREQLEHTVALFQRGMRG